MTDTPTKAYHITFSMTMPEHSQPGVITLVGSSKEEVIEKLYKMLPQHKISIVDIVDYEDIPGLIAVKKLQDEEQARQLEEKEDRDDTIDEKGNPYESDDEDGSIQNNREVPPVTVQ